jgi:hypothetical protein
MKLLKHIADAFVALVAAADIRLSHPVGYVLPRIAARRQDHQRQQARGGETERLALDESNLDEPTGFDELVTAFAGEGSGHAHRPGGRNFIAANVLLVFRWFSHAIHPNLRGKLPVLTSLVKSGQAN